MSRSERRERPVSAIVAARTRSLQSLEAPSQPEGSEESSFEEDAISEDDSLSERSIRPLPKSAELSSWRPSPETIMSSSDKETTVTLDKDKSISHIGIYDLSVVEGHVYIEGVNVLPSNSIAGYRVYAPVGINNYIPTVTGLARTSIVRFSHVENRSIRGLSALSPLFTRIWNAETDQKSFSLIRQSEDDIYGRWPMPDQSPLDYQFYVDKAADESRQTMVCGAKSCGKSTFARRLVNAYLTGPSYSIQARADIRSVLYLDLDPRLPEYTPHGQMSLVLVKEVNLGPSYTHPAAHPGTKDGINQLIRAHPFPYKDLAEYTEYFCACAHDLFQTALTLSQQDGRSPPIPIVINTPSWTNFADFEVIALLITLLKPRYVMLHEGGTDSTHKPHKDTHWLLQQTCARASVDAKIPTSLHKVPQLLFDAEPETKAVHLRTMPMLSYFHCSVSKKQGDIKPSLTFDSKPLSFMRPWELHYGATEEGGGCIGFRMLGQVPDIDSIGSILNTSLVQIVETNDPSILDLYGKLPRKETSGIPYFPHESGSCAKPLDPATSKLLFTALVRSYRPEEKLILLLVPDIYRSVAYRVDPRKIVVVVGCCDHPSWALTEDSNWDYAEREMACRDAFEDVEGGGKKRLQVDDSIAHASGDPDGSADALDSGSKDEEDGDDTGLEIDPSFISEGVEIPPWVSTKEAMSQYRGLHALRRTRKFHQRGPKDAAAEADNEEEYV